MKINKKIGNVVINILLEEDLVKNVKDEYKEEYGRFFDKELDSGGYELVREYTVEYVTTGRFYVDVLASDKNEAKRLANEDKYSSIKSNHEIIDEDVLDISKNVGSEVWINYDGEEVSKKMIEEEAFKKLLQSHPDAIKYPKYLKPIINMKDGSKQQNLVDGNGETVYL